MVDKNDNDFNKLLYYITTINKCFNLNGDLKSKTSNKHSSKHI